MCAEPCRFCVSFSYDEIDVESTLCLVTEYHPRIEADCVCSMLAVAVSELSHVKKEFDEIARRNGSGSDDPTQLIPDVTSIVTDLYIQKQVLAL